MRDQILNKLTRLNFELYVLGKQIANYSTSSSSAYPLFSVYVRNIHGWVSNWRKNFYSEVLLLTDENVTHVLRRKALELKVYFILRSQFLPFLSLILLSFHL